MGGRLDSTNIISPQVSVITNISYDHTQFLGDTITKIAKEKAGIIKKGIPVIIGENCIILENNVIRPHVKIGNDVIIENNNVISHHCIIKDHCYITSQTIIAGHVTIESNCFLGINCTIRNRIKIAKESLIGAGAVILKNTKEKEVYSVNTVMLSRKSDELDF